MLFLACSDDATDTTVRVREWVRLSTELYTSISIYSSVDLRRKV